MSGSETACGSGLACNFKRTETGFLACTVFYHSNQYSAEIARHFLRDDATNYPWLALIGDAPVTGAHLSYQSRLHQKAAIRERAVCEQHLQRRNRNFVTDRERCLRKLRPLLRPAQQSTRF